MKIARFRQPAVSALAVLLISGAGIAFAGNSSSIGGATLAAAPAAAAEPVEAVDATEPIEATGPDTDTLQEGDQTSSDTIGTDSTAAQAAAKVGAVTPKAAANTGAVAPKKVAASAEPAAADSGTETGTEASSVDEPGDASLPGGGYADDPNDPNADHQFDGVE